MRYMYHATSMDNMNNIMEKGLLPLNNEKIVYLAETEADALKFVIFRGYEVSITLKVKIYKADEVKLIETFDHSYDFFRCRAFGYAGGIPAKNISPCKYYKTLEILKGFSNKNKQF